MEPDYKNLPDEIKFDLALKLDYKTLIDYCKTSSEFLEGICGNNYFWKQKTYYDFGDLYDIEPVLYNIRDLYEDFEGDWWETYQYYRSVFSRNFIEHLQAEDVEAILDDVGLIQEREFLIVDEKTQKTDEDDVWWGVTALMVAVEKGYKDIVDFLLEEGADIEAKDNEGENALMAAAGKGYEDVVDLLISKGADIDVRDKYGYTPLMLASELNYIEMIKLLISKDADVNAKTIYGSTALIESAKLKDTVDIPRLLLSKGANVNIKDLFGKTALMYASKYGKTELVSILLEAGADATIVDKDGKSALDHLREYGDDPDIERMLQNAMSRQLPVYLF